MLGTDGIFDVFSKGSSINDVTVVGGGWGQVFCDNSTNASVIKSVTMGEGGSKMSKIA
jgi:hypothetical protein